MKNLNAETRRRGEESGDRVIGRSGDGNEILTRKIACTPIGVELSSHITAPVILSEPERLRERVEGSRACGHHRGCGGEFSRECPDAAWQSEASPGSFDSAPASNVRRATTRRYAQDDRGRLLRRILQIVIAVVHEIFDESAYERFLLRAHAARSVASYREFLREREVGIARRPRCC
jgi:hypothetical protein